MKAIIRQPDFKPVEVILTFETQEEIDEFHSSYRESEDIDDTAVGAYIRDALARR